MAVEKEPEFSRLRKFLWPIHSYELKKLVPMLVIFFLITFNYNVLRNMKDALVVTAKGSGAEVIPFIKVWVMFPMSVVMTIVFTRLCNRMRRERVFYWMVGLFLGYFAFFTFVLYPLRDHIHPHDFADKMSVLLPIGFKGMIAMVRYWSFTSFYVMSELWGNIVLFMLFWGFANDITRVTEAKRFYGLFGIGANLSGIFAGQISIWVCSRLYDPNWILGNDAWEQNLIILLCLILCSGVATLAMFRWMHQKVLVDPKFMPEEGQKRLKEKPQKLGFRDSLSYISNSRYLMYIAVIVIAYNLVLNLVEIVWKHEVRALYPSPHDYIIYMNQVSMVIGVIATLTALFVSGNSIRRFGWTFTAQIAPVILLVTSIGFFGFFFLKTYGGAAMIMGVSPLAMAVFFGSLQNALSRASKYTVYDATKEMAFIPLDTESRIRGKMVIDGVGTRFGKSGGSVIHQALLLSLGTISASAPYVACALLVVISGWIYSVSKLGKQFAALTGEESTEPVVAKAQVATG